MPYKGDRFLSSLYSYFAGKSKQFVKKVSIFSAFARNMLKFSQNLIKSYKSKKIIPEAKPNYALPAHGNADGAPIDRRLLRHW